MLLKLSQIENRFKTQFTHHQKYPRSLKTGYRYMVLLAENRTFEISGLKSNQTKCPFANTNSFSRSRNLLKNGRAGKKPAKLLAQPRQK